MDYKTLEIANELSSFVKCVWTLAGPRDLNGPKQRILPDGCMEMIFHIGDVYLQYLEDGSVIQQPRSFVFGQITFPLDIEPTGNTEIFAIRFLPEGFIPFCPIPVNEMENRAVPLQELFGDAGMRLESDVLNATTTEERIKICEAFLMERPLNAAFIDRIVTLSLEVILSLHGQLPIDELSRQMKVHRRQLERRFTSVIGLSPKQLSKIIRLQATIKMMLSKQFASLTELAYEGDYYDQAHFIKDFKEFTGMTPKKFYADNFRMSSFFYGDK